MSHDSKNPTRQQLLIAAAERFEQDPDKLYVPLYNVEGMDEDVLRTMRTTGTVLEVIVGAILPHLEVTNTVGSLMKALGLSKPDINDLACYCHHGDGAKASVMAARLRALAAGTSIRSSSAWF